MNIIPTTTGAAKAVGEIVPELAGRLDGAELRVPVVDGSLADLNVLLDRDAARTVPLAELLTYAEEPLVSSDVILDSAPCVFGACLTQASGRFAKVFDWYDNEWGHTSRLADLCLLTVKHDGVRTP